MNERALSKENEMQYSSAAGGRFYNFLFTTIGKLKTYLEVQKLDTEIGTSITIEFQVFF